ncbi:MAG: diguanylate cyclase, partial [Thiotrichales bacterium]|nr:diguanylate cyclase [Thiotrichales bacterium]
MNYDYSDDGFGELKNRITVSSLYGLGIGLLAVVLASSIIGYQMTGEFSLYGMSLAHEGHIGLRFLYLMPLALAFWGQHAGEQVMQQAGQVIRKKTSAVIKANTSLKIKSHYQATHDSMTSLPNRLEFYNRLKDSITVAERQDRTLLVMSLDLDNFKDVNELYGNHCGDQLLACVASRLSNLLPENDLVSRTGGDEFSILCLSKSREVGPDIAKRIRSAFDTEFQVEEHRIAIKGSIGIASFPKHGNTADVLVQKAELAMHAAKQYASGYVEYSGEITADNARRVALLGDLKTAIETNAMNLYYQPKIDMRSKSICAVEALLRWKHPVHGFVSPEEFIPLAEKNHLITPLTFSVIQNAMQKMKDWSEKGFELGICINISTRDLNEPELPVTIGSMLRELDLN